MIHIDITVMKCCINILNTVYFISMTDVYQSHNSLIGCELELMIPFKGMESNVDFYIGAWILSRFTYRVVNLKLIHVKGCESYDDSK